MFIIADLSQTGNGFFILRNGKGRHCRFRNIALFLFNYPLISEYISDSGRCSIIPCGNLDTGLCIGCVTYLAVADVDRNMVDGAAAARIEDQIARSHFGRGNSASAVCLFSGSTRQGNTEFLHNLLRKAGAVNTACQAVSAVYIRISHELHRIVCNVRTCRGYSACRGTGRCCR